MKMVTIYVDEDEWSGLQQTVLQLSAAGGVRISNGSYLMDLHRVNKEKTVVYLAPDQLTQVDDGKSADVSVPFGLDSEILDEVEKSKPDPAMLAASNKAADKLIEEFPEVKPDPAAKAAVETIKPDSDKKAKMKKIEETITASDKDTFFKPQTKDQQVGKVKK